MFKGDAENGDSEWGDRRDNGSGIRRGVHLLPRIAGASNAKEVEPTIQISGNTCETKEKKGERRSVPLSPYY